MRRLFLLLVLVLGGAALLAPVIMMMELDKMPGDYDLIWDGRHYLIPVTYSLCATIGLTLFYKFVKG